MKTENLKRAIEEAERFLAAARRVDAGGYWTFGKEPAAAKRASMDLTRALSELRRSN